MNHRAKFVKARSNCGLLPKQVQCDIHVDDKLRSTIDNGCLDYKKILAFYNADNSAFEQSCNVTRFTSGNFFLLHYIF